MKGLAMAQRWDDLKRQKLSAAQLADVQRKVDAEILEMNLRDLREMFGKTQADLASGSDFGQSEASRMERRNDHMVSTLRRYVAALGGELEVVAVFDNKRVHLRGV
jgi:predicted transcriptional regulator